MLKLQRLGCAKIQDNWDLGKTRKIEYFAFYRGPQVTCCATVWQTGIEFSASVSDHLMHEHKKVIWGVAISALELSGLKMEMKRTKPDKDFVNDRLILNISYVEHNPTIYQSIKVRCQSFTSASSTSAMMCRQRPSSCLGWLILGHLRRKEFLLWRAWTVPPAENACLRNASASYLPAF